MSSPKRRIFVGDIQGCADELEELLEKLRFQPSDDSLFCVGDLVNRGPGSRRALRTLVDLDAGSVLGNHDLHLLGRAEGRRKAGRGDTLDDILEADDRDELLGWLRARPLIAEWEDLIVVHAGLHPRWDDPAAVAAPLERQIRAGRTPMKDADLQFMVRVRHCDERGERPDDDVEPPAGFAPWDDFYRGARTVVFGHWAQRGLVHRPRVRGLDTGCVWGGRLTAWIAEEDRFVSVPARQAYREIET